MRRFTSLNRRHRGLPACFLFPLFVAILAVGPTARLAAELTGPSANDRQVTLVVTTLLRREHLSRKPLDDEISERTLKIFLKTLDPMKVYFYQSDVDEFMENRTSLDDLIRRGDISFAYGVFNRLLERIDERVAQVDQLLSGDFDFERDERMVINPDAAEYARNPAEAAERWRRRIKYDLLILKSDKKEGDAARERLRRRYHSYAKRMKQTSNDDLLEMYLTSMTSSFDPHTTYMSPSSLENFRILMRLNLEGIGAALQVEDGYTVVTKIIPGGAADKHGKLKPEDRIVSVGQGPDGEMEDVVDMKLNAVVKQIRGPAGTIVRLGVIPAAGGETRIYNIKRAKVELKDSEARGVIFDEGAKADGTPYRFGVIDLPSFYMDMEAARVGRDNFKSTTRDVRKILDEFKQKSVDAVILDLRHNGGGSLTEAINLTGLFIDEGPVVQVKDPDGQVQHYDDTEPGMAWDGPLVVVTSKFSASASEILAGAIQDYHRGLVIGDPATHGKGTVQSLLDLGGQLFKIPNPPNLGALKITMQQFYRPNGDSTQQRGVLSDVTLPSLTAQMDVGEADLDYPLAFDRVTPATFRGYKMVNPQIVNRLRQASQQQVQESGDFRKLLSNIERYREQKDQDSISLNEQKFFARRAELDAEKEEEKQFEEQVKPKDVVVERDYYFNHVLALSAEYVKMLAENRVARTH